MTSALALFQLGVELARAHENSAQGSVTVIPVIVDDLSIAEPVFRALAATTQGCILEASSMELRSAVPMTSDIVRRTAVEVALVNSNGTRRVLLYEPSPGLLDVRYEPSTGAEPSTGEATVLAVARAVVHSELDERAFAIITYSENGVDHPFRRCLWSLAVDHLSELTHATLRTLVVVAESRVDVGLHCQPGRGFKYAIAGSRFLRRHNKDDLIASAAYVAHYREPTVFFLGAGFSASSRFPLGNGLRDTAIRRLLAIPASEIISSEELGKRFYRWVSERDNWLSDIERAMREDLYIDQLTLEQVVRAEKRFYDDTPTLHDFKAHHDTVIDSPGQAALAFAEVLQGMGGRVIVVEVNFDRLVEHHSQIGLEVFYSDDHFRGAADYIRGYLAGTESNVPVLKLHGSIEDPATCVASDEQTLQGVGDAKLEALRALITIPDLLWIYVGASMRDRDLLPVFRSEDFARALNERWVSPYLDPAVEAFATDRLPAWGRTSRRSIYDRLITETADAFFTVLRDQLKLPIHPSA